MKTLLFLICLSGCLSSEAPIKTIEVKNVKTTSDSIYCGAACDKLRNIDIKNGNNNCAPYYQDWIVSGPDFVSTFNCKQFCERTEIYYTYPNMKPKCVLDKVQSCPKDLIDCDVQMIWRQRTQ